MSESVIESALRATLKELISVRDDTYDACTNAQGEYCDDFDREEIARLDLIIDQAQAALNSHAHHPQRNTQ